MKNVFLQLVIFHQRFFCTVFNSSPHSVIWLYGLVAVNRQWGTDGDNLSCGVESFIFHTGCKNNLQSHLIEFSYHIAPANISSSGLQMESRPKYYGREWVWLNYRHHFYPFFFFFFKYCAEFGWINHYCLLDVVRVCLSGWMCVLYMCVSPCFGKIVSITSNKT